MSYFYRAFGLTFGSSTPVPWLRHIQGPRVADVTVELGAGVTRPFLEPLGEELHRWPGDGPGSRPALLVESIREGDFLRVAYGDGALFVVDRTGSRVFGSWGPGLPDARGGLYLLTLVSGLLLRLRGITSLHASAIAVDGVAVAFAGASGAGKSTLAAAFSRMGIGVLTDNIAALGGGAEGIVVQPGVPAVFLWPQSVEALLGRTEALPRALPGWEKRALSLAGDPRCPDRAMPLAALYVLDDCRAPDGIGFHAMSGAGVLPMLVAHTYGNYFLASRQGARDFAFLARVSQQVPVRRLRRPDDISQVGETCDRILADLAQLSPGRREGAHV